VNGAPWKTPRAWSWSTLTAGFACLLLLVPAACGGGESGGGRPRPDVSGGPDLGGPTDTGTVVPDVPADIGVPPEDVEAPTDVPPAPDVPKLPPVITILEPAEGAAVRRADPDGPVVFRVRVEHAEGLSVVEFSADGQPAIRRSFPQGTPSGEFTFALDDYFARDDAPAAGPDEVVRRWPHEGPKTFKIAALSTERTAAVARRTIYIDETPPDLLIVDAPQDRGLEVLDVVGQIRVQFRASDSHELKESRVSITWEGGEEARTLAPTRTSEYLVIQELDENVALAEVKIEAEDMAGWLRTITLPVRIVRRPPYRLGHVFEFPGEVEVLGYAVGHYDDAEPRYPDLFVATTGGLWLLLGTEGGQFAGGFKLLDPPPSPWQKVLLHDMDHDGLEDLFLAALDGDTLRGTVAIRVAREGGAIDDYVPFPNAAVVTDASLAIGLDDLDEEDDWVDLAVGLSSAEDSVAVLRGSPVPDLPLVDVVDPLAPDAACEPACSTAGVRYACSAGLCAIEVQSDCAPACAAGEVCVYYAPTGSSKCLALAPDEACGGCRVGERCFGAAGAESCRRFLTDDCDPACAPSYTCSFGECVLTPTDDCELACAADETCHRGECVLRVGGACEPACGDQQVCQDGTCLRLDQTCDPPCLAGQVCHAGQCRRLCDEEGCAPAPDYLAFFLRPNHLRGVAGVTDLDIADFNGDDRNDIVVGRTGVRQISCYIGLGDGDFLDAYDTYLDDDPYVVHPYRMAGPEEDEYLDLLVATETDEQFYILRGDGTGFFDIAWMFDDSAPYTDFATIDIFTPGDIVTLQPSASVLRTWRYQAAQGALSTNAFSEGAFSAGFSPGELSVEDMNLDGNQDVVYINRATGRLVVGLGMDDPQEDVDLPPEILMPYATGPDYDSGLADLVDIAVGRVHPAPSSSNDYDDLVTLTHVAAPPGDPIPIGLDAPRECGAPVGVSPTREVLLVAYRSDGLRPSKRYLSQSILPPVFGDPPVALALGRFDGSDANLDVAVAIDRAPDTWTIAERCQECPEPEEGEPAEPCLPDPESMREAAIPNIAILRTQIEVGPRGEETRFVPYRAISLDDLVDASVAGLGFGTAAAPPEYLPPGQIGQKGFQKPTGIIATELSNDALDDLIVLSDEYKTDEDPDFAPAQMTTWRAPFNASGIFDGPRFGATLGRAPRWWTLIDADGLLGLDLLVSNTGDDDLTLLRSAGALLRFLTPRYLATQNAPLGIAAANLDRSGERVQDFVVAVEGNVQIGYSRPPFAPAEWAFDDVVFLYPGETYPREDPSAVQVADLNLDGQLDIITSNQGSDTLTIFFGVVEAPRPHPLFPVYVDAPTGHEPTRLVQGHFNADDCPDFAVRNDFSESVTLLLSVPEQCVP